MRITKLYWRSFCRIWKHRTSCDTCCHKATSMMMGLISPNSKTYKPKNSHKPNNKTCSSQPCTSPNKFNNNPPSNKKTKPKTINPYHNNTQPSHSKPLQSRKYKNTPRDNQSRFGTSIIMIVFRTILMGPLLSLRAMWGPWLAAIVWLEKSCPKGMMESRGRARMITHLMPTKFQRPHPQKMRKTPNHKVYDRQIPNPHPKTRKTSPI